MRDLAYVQQVGRLQAENDDPEGQPGAIDWDGNRHRGSYTGVAVEAFVALSGRQPISRISALHPDAWSRAAGARDDSVGRALGTANVVARFYVMKRYSR